MVSHAYEQFSKKTFSNKLGDGLQLATVLEADKQPEGRDGS